MCTGFVVYKKKGKGEVILYIEKCLWVIEHQGK